MKKYLCIYVVAIFTCSCCHESNKNLNMLNDDQNTPSSSIKDGQTIIVSRIPNTNSYISDSESSYDSAPPQQKNNKSRSNVDNSRHYKVSSISNDANETLRFSDNNIKPSPNKIIKTKNQIINISDSENYEYNMDITEQENNKNSIESNKRTSCLSTDVIDIIESPDLSYNTNIQLLANETKNITFCFSLYKFCCWCCTKKTTLNTNETENRTFCSFLYKFCCCCCNSKDIKLETRNRVLNSNSDVLGTGFVKHYADYRIGNNSIGEEV